jgi:major vault protein
MEDRSMERTSRKIPVTERQFLWVQDDDKGEVTLHVGPTMVSPTAADRVVVDDGQGGFREDLTGRPQSMIELGDNQYAVLFNPLSENDGGPNGRFRPGRNESRPQRNGTRSMIPGPCSFYLRPGQRADVRDAHELASNQYLVVKVYGEVDKSAPYYEVTARSAGITRATAEGADEHPLTAAEMKPLDLKRGQLIVIRGLDTQFYIPPTGVDIVPDTSVDDTGAAITAAAARQLLAQLPPPPPSDIPAAMPAAEPEAAMDMLAADEGGEAEQAAKGTPRRQMVGQYIDQSARNRGRKPIAPAGAPAAPAPAGPAFAKAEAFGSAGEAAPQQAPQVGLGDVLSSATIRRALEKEVRQARLIRRAVVLGEKEYCVIVDADGKREIKVGPARVFPGPYDTFMTVGSRGRVYDAYELLPQRALWLRVIAPISRAELSAKLPRGVVLDKDEYFPGDELLLTGVSTFFFPFNEIEVLSPETGQAVVGNDHARVFIEAIGIDQRSGIYVRDLSTGEARLVRGKQSYLVDPRKEVQITRTVPAGDWNLWIAANEPHKQTGRPIVTPWALSITVPNNMAVLVTSANDRKVIQGPCVTLLGFEETLTTLLLSTGTPKDDSAPLRTCFLRTVGNRVSDMITVETADFVKISVRVSYSVTFLPEHRDKWFNHENYIQVMVDHLRSIVRGRCRTMPLSTLWPEVPSAIRDTILGERKEGGRPGRLFPENGTIVTEVEVLSAVIEDHEVAALMQRVQTETVTLTIGDRKAQDELSSARLRASIEQEKQELAEQAKTREAKLKDLARKLWHEATLADAQGAETIAREKQSLADTREEAAQKARLARAAAEKAADLSLMTDDARVRAEAQRLLDGARLEAEAKLKDLEIKLLAAQSAATVAERQAVQRQLVEAMTALGDKLYLTEVAHNMNLVSLFKGKDVGTILREVLGGTKVMPTLRALIDAASTPEDGAPGPT